MASTIEQIDSYLRKNKKPLYANLNKWFGEKKANGAFLLSDDAKNLKSLWEDAQKAKGINNKLASFNKLKEELSHWSDDERLAQLEEHLDSLNMDDYEDPESKLELEQYRFFNQLSNYPETSKLDDLTIDDVYSGGYDYEQMKALADQYGYDYKDKDDRKEFLDKLSKYHQEKAINEIWNDDLYTGIVTPIAKEYAKNNWQNIDSDDYIGTQGPKLPLVGNVGFGIPTNAKMFGTVAADAGVNTLMAGIPGGAAGKYLKFAPKGQMIVNNTVAPAARAGLNYFINDKSGEDVAKDALNEMATNFAFRFGIRGAQKYGKELIPTGGKQTLQGRANEMANAARDRANVHFRMPKRSGEEGFEYWVYDKNGVPKPSTYKEWLNDPKRIINDGGMTVELETQKDALLTNKRFPLSENAIKNIVKYLEKAGTEPEQMLYDEIAAMGAPRESIWNFAMNNPVSRDVGSYINNLQGRSKWGGAALGQITNLDPTQTVSQKTFQKTPKLSKQDMQELELLQRLRDLHVKNPKLFANPKIPEKFKDYFNKSQVDQWNDNIKLSDIFN